MNRIDKFAVAVVGQGAREHAICWKVKQSPLCAQLHVWPGNVLMADLAIRHALPAGEHGDIEALATDIAQVGIDLVICGPEQPLVAGLTNALNRRGIPCFGPSKAASFLESSKVFAKKILKNAGIATADYDLCSGHEDVKAHALARLAREGAVVIKADGLASGKGVFVCHSSLAVEQALERLEQLGLSCAEVICETCLEGREVSFFYLVGKKGWEEIGAAVDFKRLSDDDRGPNTGGMGCYTPVPWLPAHASADVRRLIIEPLIRQLEREGIAYQGFLYCGLMWTNSGPRVIEFNIRLGDPEAQVLAIADDRDWLAMIGAQLGLCKYSAPSYQPSGKTVGVVATNEGYPYESPSPAACGTKWSLTELRSQSKSFQLFGGGVNSVDGSISPGKGRVLTAVSTAESFASARSSCYDRLHSLASTWPQCHMRSDIASRAAEIESTH